MKLFITGISGLLGLNLALQTKDDFTVSGAFHSQPVSLPGCETVPLDVTSPQEVDGALGSLRPDLIIHTVAMTDVDRCESNPTLAQELNQVAARNVARSAAAIGARLVHISTDHLFSGTNPWTTESESPTPVNVYARTKFEGETSVREACPDALIVRTNFFGWGTSVRTSFSDWVLGRLRDGQDLNMFSDAYFTPVLINDMVDLILKLVDHEATGVINIGGADRISKYGFALELAREFGYSADRITPVSMDTIDLNAVRPKDMSFSSQKIESLLDTKMPALADSLARLKSLSVSGWPGALESAIAGPAALSNMAN